MKLSLVLICFMFATALIGQKGSLENVLWEEVGGRIDTSKNHGGQYEIIDDAKNGYLKVAFTEDGCGCYSETTVAAYRGADGKYTTLKMHWNGCSWKKKLSSTQGLQNILPEDFGLHTFLKTAKKENDSKLSAMLFIDAILPRKGTDTRIDLKYVPFGFRFKGDDRILSLNGYDLSEENHKYRGDLKQMFLNFIDPETVEFISKGEFDKIAVNDKKYIDELFGENKKFKSYKSAQALVKMLKHYYKISKAIEYKSAIFGWNREEARFCIKEKIKNDTPELSFLEFVRQLPFLMALC